MSSKTELSDLIIKAYAHQKNGESLKAITAWNNLLNHQFADKDLKASIRI
ncbi:hypothetical protein [Abyssogena phaseoliformis symbiont]|nr:hypothetical protein [Abyssogena phaseoliformis symbiont]